MPIERLDFLVEEISIEETLRVLLPKILKDNVDFEIYRYQGKDDLLKKLPVTLRGYSRWLPDNWRIFVLVDKDNEDCQDLKQNLENIAESIGLSTKTKNPLGNYRVINRIVIEELEAWFFGDMEAVRNAYPRVKVIEKQERYRDPDAIKGGTWESFERVLQNAGYFKGGLPKLEVAREIATYLEPERNRSNSFQAFYAAVMEQLN